MLKALDIKYSWDNINKKNSIIFNNSVHIDTVNIQLTSNMYDIQGHPTANSENLSYDFTIDINNSVQIPYLNFTSSEDVNNNLILNIFGLSTEITNCYIDLRHSNGSESSINIKDTNITTINIENHYPSQSNTNIEYTNNYIIENTSIDTKNSNSIFDAGKGKINIGKARDYSNPIGLYSVTLKTFDLSILSGVDHKTTLYRNDCNESVYKPSELSTQISPFFEEVYDRTVFTPIISYPYDALPTIELTNLELNNINISGSIVKINGCYGNINSIQCDYLSIDVDIDNNVETPTSPLKIKTIKGNNADTCVLLLNAKDRIIEVGEISDFNYLNLFDTKVHITGSCIVKAHACMDGVVAVKVAGPPYLNMTGLYSGDLSYIIENHKEHELNEITFQKHSFLNNEYIFNKTTTYHHSLVFKTNKTWPSKDDENYEDICRQIIDEYVKDYAWKSHIYNKDMSSEEYKNKQKKCRQLQLLLIARFKPNQLEDKINTLNDIYGDIQFEKSEYDKINSDKAFVDKYHELLKSLPGPINIDYSSDTAYIIMYQTISQEIYDNILCMPSNISYVYIEDGSYGYSPFTKSIYSNNWTSTKLGNPCRLCLNTQVTKRGAAQYCKNCKEYLCTHKDCKIRLKNNITQVIISKRYLWWTY